MKILQQFKINDARSIRAQKNIILLFINKVLALLISFQLIPATLGYVDSAQYGIWIALSSLVSWMIYFDFGLTHGFRNGFAAAKAKGDKLLAKQYLSTSYVILTVIFSVIMVICLIVNQFLGWSEILSVDKSLNSTLHIVIIILVIFFAIQMVLNLFTTFLLADQRPGISAMVVTSGQFFALISIYILAYTTEGSLINLAFVLVGVPAFVIAIISIVFFRTTFREYLPAFRFVNWKLSRSIIGLGSKFFIIQLAMLLVFQFANFIIIKVMGAEAVASYNIAYKYFSIIYVALGIVFLPFWSAFTEAYTKREFSWMASTYQKLSNIWFLSIVIYIVLLMLSPYVFKYWLAKTLPIDFKLSVAMGINMLILSRANLYMFCLNGIGKVYIQMIVYSIFALISIPLMYIFTDMWGFYGILIVVSLVHLCQAIVGHIQLNKILKNTDNGIWSK